MAMMKEYSVLIKTEGKGYFDSGYRIVKAHKASVNENGDLVFFMIHEDNSSEQIAGVAKGFWLGFNIYS